jgi:hypothetical protein
MTQRTLPAIPLHGAPVARTTRTATPAPAPWWTSLTASVSSALHSLAGTSGPTVSGLPREVLREYDPALHRALTDLAIDPGMDVRARSLFS